MSTGCTQKREKNVAGVHVIASCQCTRRRVYDVGMRTQLISDIDAFLQETGMGEYRFGFEAVKNGRLVERLREGGRVWPETETQIRAFMIVARQTRNVERAQ